MRQRTQNGHLVVLPFANRGAPDQVARFAMPRSSAKRAPLGEMSLNHAMEKIAAKPQELNQTPMSPTFIEVTFDDGTGEDADEGVAPYSDDSGSDTDEEGWLDDVDLEKIEVLMRRTAASRPARRGGGSRLYRHDRARGRDGRSGGARPRARRARTTRPRAVSSSSVDENDSAGTRARFVAW